MHATPRRCVDARAAAAGGMNANNARLFALRRGAAAAAAAIMVIEISARASSLNPLAIRLWLCVCVW